MQCLRKFYIIYIVLLKGPKYYLVPEDYLGSVVVLLLLSLQQS